jgi:hypothetical protein
MSDALMGIFGEQDPADKARYYQLFRAKPESRQPIRIDPAYKLDDGSRLSRSPGGTESDEVDILSSVEVSGQQVHGMYRGRWLKDMSQVELFALVLSLAEKLEDERLEAGTQRARFLEALEELRGSGSSSDNP